MEYKEEEYLQISGLERFRFCPRQWAMVHIEQQWEENARTVEGNILHERAHDGTEREKRGDTIITRDMRVFSPTMGISGACDVVEFHASPDGVTIQGAAGTYLPFPVEYKRGAPRNDTVNAVQLCAQAMCLEEMLCCEIPEGALYYGETRHREIVEFSSELRQEVRELAERMHDLYRRGRTPKARLSKSCNACSLKDVCLPKLVKKKSVTEYLKIAAEE